MIKKYLLIFLFFLFLSNCAYCFLGKKEKAMLLLSNTNPYSSINNEIIDNQTVFLVNDRIYFYIYLEDGFKSDFIKYQIIKQDDNAHVGGYSRVFSKTVRVKNPNSYCDYFLISQKGKYFIQIFDIENLHHWRAIGGFRVVED